jgi:hypothetical protein
MEDSLMSDDMIVRQDSSNSRAAVYNCSGNNTDSFLDLQIVCRVRGIDFDT